MRFKPSCEMLLTVSYSSVGFLYCSLWMAGGGVKGGHVHGATDDFAWNITRDPVHVHDHQATILHLCGIDHERMTYRYQGRQFRFTDIHGKVVRGILA